MKLSYDRKANIAYLRFHEKTGTVASAHAPCNASPPGKARLACVSGRFTLESIRQCVAATHP